MKAKLLLTLASLALALPLYAQDNEQPEKKNEFNVDVQLRSRGEYDNGNFKPRDKGQLPGWSINERARLGIGYARKNLEIRLAAQHVGVWGQDAMVEKKGRLALNEAWAKLSTNNGRFFAVIGRQSLSYDGDRILGTLDWNVAGRWHDALKLGYQDGKNTLHLIFAYNQNKEDNKGGYYDTTNAMPYKTMLAGWYHFKAPKFPLDASLMFLNIGYETGTPEKGATSYLQTIGTKIDYGYPTLNGTLEAYYQFGKKIKDVSTSAFMIAINGNYKPAPWVNIGLGLDYLSGMSPTSKKNTAFDPLYGTHHKYYGFMDYFYAQVWNQWGLINPHLSGDFKLHQRSSLLVTYHYFAAAANPKKWPGYENVGRGLGSEIDLQFTYKVLQDVTLQCGYSVMFGTKNMDALKGGNHKSWQDWGWVQININPRIFSIKW